MMLSKPRPTPSSRPSHSTSQSHRTSSKSSTTPMSTPAVSRIPPSVGQALPPNINTLRTPSAVTDVRTPSPNYFGLIVDPNTDPRDSGVGPKDNWSPPTSSILSFGAASPKHLPLDANPDFEAFRRQTQSNNSFSLSHGNLTHFASTPGVGSTRPRVERKPTRTDIHEDPLSPRTKTRDGPQDSAGPGDFFSHSKETTASMNAPSFFDIPRQQSPATITPSNSVPRNALSHLDDRHPRLSLPQNRVDPPSPRVNRHGGQQRAETLPPSLEDGPTMIAASKLKDMLKKLPGAAYLLLDLRVFPQFSQSRIQNALNLCIPTTLLKRPSFNLQKLQDTFTNDGEKARFAKWAEAKFIIVYDSFSSDKKDATSAVNTLKKFTNEGWGGQCYILSGGFAEFSKTYPQLIDQRTTQEVQSSTKISLSLGTSMPDVAPVAGGCVMPATKNAANPFFSNVRQNQDLIGGVGQMDIQIPGEMNNTNSDAVPRWLAKAAEPTDHGKKVSDKFLHLELDEQARMNKALSNGVQYGNTKLGAKEVQIAGIEKGGKNRYNNIWPFEHARVRLQGRPEGSCDYVNASHVKASRSNKRYIASQGPLPATFEDFWSVIWDHDVRVIVMLTAESEGGQLKCHPYWASKEYGPMRLKPLSEKRVSLEPHRRRSGAEQDRKEAGRRRAATTTTAEASPSPGGAEQPHAIIRKFTLAHSSHPFQPMREITQIHYSSWPDFGAPANANQLLGLVELSNSMQRASSSSTKSPRSDEPEAEDNARPVLVHCSAGCGRTGTFCTIDSVIDMLKRQRKENKSGVTPMEGMSSGNAPTDYMSSAQKSPEIRDDWLFDPELDLVQKTVEDFRGQRLSMVQSLRQYVLCYETILEWINQQQSSGAKPNGRERSGSDTATMLDGKN
ncbi:Tyrosine-protein phosphatase 1 [Phlyctema vagabunda]|uniref:protein-tyrosine-phosphatase n=1 Tax=Phlyctema vagabunda TaxID=108571 RepID=A0ABR4PD83_9HELO